MILTCFSGSGKTTLAKKSPLYIDLESSDFQWIYPDNTGLTSEELKGRKDLQMKNENFITDYVDKVEELHIKNFIVLIASQPSVLKELEFRGLNYSVVTPNFNNLSDYRLRYYLRNNNTLFIRNMINNFNKFVFDLQSNQYADYIFILEDYSYVSDIEKDIILRYISK